MGFKSFLKAIGTGAAKLGPTAIAGARTVDPALGQNDVFQTISAVVIATETTAAVLAGDKTTGPQKLQAVLPLVISTLKSTPLIRSRRIADEQKFDEGAQSIVNGVVSILNSLSAEEKVSARETAA